MESKSVEILAMRRAFLQASDDLSADLIIEESLRAFNEARFLEKIEESLVSKNEEMFNHYMELLNDVKN
ncbi:IDEAL domain-containing protein [Nosocomiicoccus ampullae]|uniref:IDEAL domain-containing protein n=1 Tax=Nosocomiicoccus ampullae TaxID=489910 RepID=UPI001C5F487F|nr:IDEAL domain-containing protein [Nosocomiicoccus ampullae]QYA48020.1 IDEAL domain-containing protein [Nosocomiicoccus ampullae]HJB78071.1 IDEAL domain-containing protein [Candidatus Nosocomiicoccus stercorigallinarum]